MNDTIAHTVSESASFTESDSFDIVSKSTSTKVVSTSTKVVSTSTKVVSTSTKVVSTRIASNDTTERTTEIFKDTDQHEETDNTHIGCHVQKRPTNDAMMSGCESTIEQETSNTVSIHSDKRSAGDLSMPNETKRKKWGKRQSADPQGILATLQSLDAVTQKPHWTKFEMIDGSFVTGILEAIDSSIKFVVVTNLDTPLGIVPSAVLRVSDISKITIPNDETPADTS